MCIRRELPGAIVEPRTIIVNRSSSVPDSGGLIPGGRRGCVLGFAQFLEQFLHIHVNSVVSAHVIGTWAKIVVYNQLNEGRDSLAKLILQVTVDLEPPSALGVEQVGPAP